MQLGKILVADHKGAYVIKLVGDVRLTLCTTIDEYVRKMFLTKGFIGVIVDLSEAEGIDSTTLGLLAKLAVQAKNNNSLLPLAFSPNPNITRLLESMGFNAVFDIRTHLDNSNKTDLELLLEMNSSATELSIEDANEEQVRDKVIEAHRVLMALNEKNRVEFSDLVTTLEMCN